MPFPICTAAFVAPPFLLAGQLVVEQVGDLASRADQVILHYLIQILYEFIILKTS
uniref:Uncharacterized protein n=1 Tax=uncultured bacterium A1Q1_fos_660 TaxID=1256588 RepID=L7VUL1_9BACT|nr:hypothetical protein [uncultured bacterium A1Q1_fos_660]